MNDIGLIVDLAILLVLVWLMLWGILISLLSGKAKEHPFSESAYIALAVVLIFVVGIRLVKMIISI